MQCPEALLRDMGVDLGRADVRMAEHGLNGSEISTMYEQVCREGVTKCVRRYVAPHPGAPRIVIQADPEILPGHGGAAVAEEHVGVAVGPHGEVLLDCRLGAVTIRNESVLAALSGDDDPAIMPLVATEAYQLRHPKPRCVQQFEHCCITKANSRGSVRCSKDARHLML